MEQRLKQKRKMEIKMGRMEDAVWNVLNSIIACLGASENGPTFSLECIEEGGGIREKLPTWLRR